MTRQGFGCVLVVPAAVLSCVMPSRADVRQTAGVGIALRQDGDQLFVNHVLPDSPAAASESIHVNDRIIAVGDESGTPMSVKGLKLAEAARLIRGPKGTIVRLTIVPAGKADSEAHVASLVRGELKSLSRWGDGAQLKPGTKAPDIEMLVLTSGKPQRLAEHAGKIIVIEFWATWCGPCQKVVAELQTYGDKHPDWKDNVVFIAASLDDDKETAVKHVQAQGWHKTHNVWVDVAAIKAFHVDSLPTTYVIDGKGHVAGTAEDEVATIITRLIAERSGPR